jgi:hypothetical protein
LQGIRRAETIEDQRKGKMTRMTRFVWGLSTLAWVGVVGGTLPDAAAREKTEVLPAQQPAPAVVSIDQAGAETELRRQLRKKTGVSELTEAGSSIPFSQAPTGRYGFITPPSLAMALVVQSPDLVLERVPPGANAYEIHKLADGNGLLVGFVGSEILPDITRTERPKNIQVALHSNPSDKAPYIIAVPLTKLATDRMPTRLDPKKPESVMVLHVDLRSTGVRPSTHGVPR